LLERLFARHPADCMIQRPPSLYRLLLVACLLLTASARAQGPQDWINPAQTYYKIPSVQRALIRLTTADLRGAGVPDGTDPRAVQVFHRGRELAIFVAGQSDGRFDATDYVEFLARGADGRGDSALYYPRNAQPHTYYNLYTDTTAYFLTWRLDGGPGLRMAEAGTPEAGTRTPEPYHLAERLELRTGDYAAGSFYPIGSTSWSSIFYTTYDWGEGYTGGILRKNAPGPITFQLPGYVRSGPAPAIELQVMGRDPSNHVIDLRAGPSASAPRLLQTAQVPHYRYATFRETLTSADVSPGNECWISTLSRGTGTEDAYCHTYARLTYPQAFAGGTFQSYRLRPNPAGTSLVEIPDAPTDALLLDVTDETRPVRLRTTRSGTTLRAVVPGTEAGRSLLLVSTRTPPLALRPVRFRAHDLRRATFALVSHAGLMQPAGGYPDAVRAYAAYRASAAGGGHDTLVVTMQELADQFNYGEWSPLAIRNFAAQWHRTGTGKFLFLMGQSRWPHHMRTRRDRYALDPVPNAGWPSADPPLVMGLNGDAPFHLSLPVGRLNAATPQTVADYLDKVKAHEATAADELWPKNVLHLSGGRSAGELSLFRGYVDEFRRKAESGTLGPRVETLSKRTDDPVEFINITERINRGVGVMTFFGHSSGESADIDVGLASNPQLGYQNTGRYPFVFVNGCDAGNIFLENSLQTFGSDWVNTPGRGAILFLSMTYAGYPFALKSYSDRLYESLFGDSTLAGKPFGLVWRAALQRYDAGRLSVFEQAHAQQFTLQGDPAVVLFPATQPDYAISEAALSVEGLAGGPVPVTADSFRVVAVVSNLGRTGPGPLAVTLRRTGANGTTVDLGTRDFPAVRYQDTLRFTVRNDPATGGGPNAFELILDPQQRLTERTRANNRATLYAVLPGTAALPLIPQPFAVLNTTEGGTPTVTLTAEASALTRRAGVPVPRNYAFELDTAATFTSPFRKTGTVAAAHLISWKTALLTADSVVYFWRVRDADQPAGPANQWAERSFTFIRSLPDGWSQRGAAQLSQTSAGPNSRTSPQIGPATRWATLGQEVPPAGTALDVWGVDAAGEETRLLSGITTRLTDLSGIDPARYPYLRLRLRSATGTPPPRAWTVAFTGVPEVVVDPVLRPFEPASTRQEGEPYRPVVAFRNISGQAFRDSVLIRQVLTNRSTGRQQVRQRRIGPLGAGQSYSWETAFETLGNAGDNLLRVTVNADRLPEQTYLNNTAELAIAVEPDRTAPVLSVAVDGRLLRDGDLVAARPAITVTLRDENRYLVRQDTTGVDVWLGPDSLQAPLSRLAFRAPGSTWQLEAANTFRAELRPGPLAAGTYQLRVQGRDQSGNLAGALPYIVRFRVMTDAGRSPLVVYPNPTRAFATFSFEAAGAQVEGRFRLRVFTLQGKLVGEYVQVVRTGTNAYRWEGTDASGQPLPAGTYLYEALVRSNQPELDGTPWRGRVVLIR
jgi:hypothetical protein